MGEQPQLDLRIVCGNQHVAGRPEIQYGVRFLVAGHQAGDAGLLVGDPRPHMAPRILHDHQGVLALADADIHCSLCGEHRVLAAYQCNSNRALTGCINGLSCRSAAHHHCAEADCKNAQTFHMISPVTIEQGLIDGRARCQCSPLRLFSQTYSMNSASGGAAV